MRIGVLALVGACVANPPPQNAPGPAGTWTCKQIVESCDSMCSTGICLDACTNQGDPEAQQLHASLLGCAARNRCTEDNCTRAVCGAEIQLCVNEGQPAPEPKPRMVEPHEPQPPHDHALPPIDKRPPREPDHPPAAHTLTAAAVAGTWSYGNEAAVTQVDKQTGVHRPGTGTGGMLRLDADGRFERATETETAKGKCKTTVFSYAIGAWKVEGETIVLSEKQATAALRDSCKKSNNYDRDATAKDDRRALRLTDKHDLELTGDDGNVETYHSSVPKEPK